MSTPLRVLIIEDSEDDARLTMGELQQRGYDPIFERVDTAPAMRAALNNQTWDAVIADYNMAHFSAVEALALLRESDLYLPFIVVSDTIGEETAVTAIKAGAHDYLMKDNLARLAPALERELREAEAYRQRKQAEEDRRDSEEKTRLMFQAVPEGIMVTDLEANVLELNEASVRMHGYDRKKELIGKNAFELIAEKDRARAIANTSKVLGDRMFQPVSYEATLLRKDGSEFPAELSGAILKDGDGNPIGFVAVTKDITERKQTEQKHQTIIQKTIEGFCITDRDGRLLEVNDAYCQMVGYTREELLNMSAPEIIADEHPWEAAKHIENIVRDGYDRFESQHKHKDGRLVDFEVSANYLNDVGEGQIFVFLRDITEHKKAEARLRESMEKLRLMFKSVPEGITVSDLNGTILETNEATINIHGYDNKEDLIGKSAFELIAEKDHGQAMENLKDELEKDNIKTVEYRFLRKNGSEFPAELTAARLRDGAGNPIGFVAVTRDITERKRVEEAIRQSEERLRLLVESTEDAVVMIDLEGRTIYFNAAKKHGLEDKDVLGKKFSELFDSETVTSMSQQFREVVENGKATIVERQINLMGQELWFSEQLSPVINAEGQIIATVLISRNITEQKKMQEQLILADRLASIGELAAGIAHELNNPLTGVIGLSQLLTQKNVPSDIREDLDLVYSEAQRAANVVKNLLTFARKHTPVKELTDVNEVLNKVLELRSYEQRVNNIAAVTNLAADLPQVKADYFQLQQVFLNIIINAEHFMIEANGKGTMSITTEPVGDRVRASFNDDGPGISKEDLRNIFNPFFTTKEVGKGTGLGLSICHGIVSAHGGQIFVESEPGRGATFTVELPLDPTETVS